MITPTLRIAIGREALGLDPLLCSASIDDAPWAIVGYAEPARQARISYAESPFVDGSFATSATWQQSILGFDLRPRRAVSELEVRVMAADLTVALSQFTFETTVSQAGYAETWLCDRGSIGAVTRDFVDLANLIPVYPVTIPVQPIPATSGGA